MEVMIETCCGIDVHQKSIVCCILDGPLDTNKPKKIQKKFGTTTVALQNALDWVLENHVTHVFFESTGQYWLPLFNIFSDSDLVLVLANPQHIKNVPGRKTDMKDAEWIAQLGRCGLIEPSYIPGPEVVQLRLLTRRMRSYKQRQTQVKNEIHNLLQRANIKLTSYLSDIFSKTGQALLALFVNGVVIDETSILVCIQKRVKASPEELLEAMNGKLSLEDRFLIGQSLHELQMYQEMMDRLEKEIQDYIKKSFPEEYGILMTIPGVSETCAAVILAEIGPTVEAFPSDAHLASWVGLCPGSYESAGVKKSSHITQGNRYIKQALTMSGMIAAHSKDVAFSSFYQRVSQRGSKMKAVIACAHKLLRII
ncbi:TPA: IS110 family transposase, partial [Streptococcus agalactiae]|nr:IS110 family transposase [Streptococcus agalactiae]